MTGISKVVLKNIRSHLDTVVEFDPHFNVVAGESDEGKSAIFWAIYWVFFNPAWSPRPWKRLKPKGESRAEIHFFDGDVVARVLDKGKNFYELNGEKLAGLHGKVPDQVKAVLQVTDANIQMQKEMFFLLNETSGRVAREINKVAKLETMDKAITMAISRVKETTKEIAGLENLIQDWIAEITLKSPILEVDTMLTALEQRETSQDTQAQKISDVRNSLEHCAQLKKQLSDLPSDDCVLDVTQLREIATEQLQLRSQIDDCQNSATRIKQLQKELATYEGLITAAELVQVYSIALEELKTKQTRIDTVTSAITQYRSAQNSVDSAVSDDCIQIFNALALRAGELQEERERVKTIERVLNTIDDINSDIENLQDGIDIEQEELDELRGGMETCPTCDRKM